MIAEDGGAVAPGEAVLTNANIFLPLANLTPFQKALLDPSTARSAAAEVTPEALAAGMGAFTFLPRRTLGDPEIAAIAKCLAHNRGVQVLPDTIQYLNERSRVTIFRSKRWGPAQTAQSWWIRHGESS
jgi:hypothetical protein